MSEQSSTVMDFPSNAGSTDQPSELWSRCEKLARSPDILDEFVSTLKGQGVVGEERAAKLLYLVMTTRLLERPVSAVVKGPSSAGKSYLSRSVLRYFPNSAYRELTAMSERALAYTEEPMKHRMLVLYEAAGLRGETANYLMRSLISEGEIRYETVESVKDVGLRPRSIVREGPTGLLLTTTAVSLHPENETRLFSIPMTDGPEQTAAILSSMAEGRSKVSTSPEWVALQEWLQQAEHRVYIPYATALALAIPPIAVRLRRDFGALLQLIKGHAILHQARRDRQDDGTIITNLNDYAAVYELVHELVAEGIEASVSLSIRETVGAVHAITKRSSGSTTTLAQVAKELGLDKSAASRRVSAATELGYLTNSETRKGFPLELDIGEPLPEEREILPRPDDARLRDCTVDAGSERGRPYSDRREDRDVRETIAHLAKGAAAA